jgi:hypothetical protein
MRKNRLKLMLALGLLAAGGMTAPALLGRVGAVVERAETGADPAGGLTPLRIPVDGESIEWEPDAELPRLVEPGTRAAVAEAYLISLALLDGTAVVADDELAVHLTGPALAAAAAEETPVLVLDRSHRLRVVFYSADGQLIELEDEATRVLAVDRRAVIQSEEAVSVLVQIDGTWHLRHRIVQDAASHVITIPPQ